MRSLSIIVPAFNEEKYLGCTLERIHRAIDRVCQQTGASAEVLVVDNASTDDTGHVAEAQGARVVPEPFHNIARVRNTGARAAAGEVLVFVDADTLVPEDLFARIHQVMSGGECAGGAVDTEYRPSGRLQQGYLAVWRLLGRLASMAQGATQFCRRDLFEQTGGYDETLYMGEDVEFFWRLKKAARDHGLGVCYLRDLRVAPSCRRFDQWPFWRILIWTNPLFIHLFARRKGTWNGWYQEMPR
jgi:glycosyltransferase involved in cell wall biosynthesis